MSEQIVLKASEYLLLRIKKKHPHIEKNLKAFWGSKDFHEYVKKLTINDRPTPRQGFETDIFDAIIVLSNIHQELYGFVDVPASPFFETW